MFETIRKGDLIEIWMPPIGDPEGELILSDLHADYVPSLIASLKKFEQQEGRS
jgi:hypothetical protein